MLESVVSLLLLTSFGVHAEGRLEGMSYSTLHHLTSVQCSKGMLQTVVSLLFLTCLGVHAEGRLEQMVPLP